MVQFLTTPELVDDILGKYDLNQDGLLDYSEFMTSFKENHEKLKPG